MRCTITNPKTLRKLSKATGLNVLGALVRGNTNHRYDLKTDKHDDYDHYSFWPDGTLYYYDTSANKRIILKEPEGREEEREALKAFNEQEFYWDEEKQKPRLRKGD
jgi:hypothetical protein